MKRFSVITARTGHDDGFLPDFCNIRVVFIIVVSAELLAFVLALGPGGTVAERWSRLSLLSLFIQLIALTCSALLCLGRSCLNRMGSVAGGTAAYLLIVAVTGVYSEAAYRAGRGTGLEYVVLGGWHTEFLMRSVAVGAIVGAVILRYFYVQHRTRRTLESESRARFQALQARIRPHFLFNGMNTIASLIRSDPALAEEVTEDLAELFRIGLADGRRVSTLGEELTLVRRYLKIEALRLGGRLRVVEALEGLPGAARVPALLLQPLVENAVYHGIEPRAEGGTVEIKGRRRGDTIRITVSNPRSPDVAVARRAGNRMALNNVRDRLRLAYGRHAHLDIGQDEGRFTVSLVFPYRKESEG